MPVAGPTRRESRRRDRRRRLRRRALLISGAALLVGALAWVGVRGLLAKNELETARAQLDTLQEQLIDFQFADAAVTLAEVQDRTDAAVNLTGDPVWRVFEFVPIAGSNLRVVRELSEVADDVVDQVGAPLVDLVRELDPASIAPRDGAIDVAPFVEAVPVVTAVSTSAQEILARAEAIDAGGTIEVIAGARDDIARLLTQVSNGLSTGAEVMPLIPAALGADGARSYVVMFQNNAEARALGGTALSFAVLNIDQGRIELEEVVPAGFGNFEKTQTSVLPAPDGAEYVYPGLAYGTYIPNVTIRPSFDTAAQLTMEMWRRSQGRTFDGVLSIDPVALSYILAAGDPVTLSTGDVLDRNTLVPLLLNTVYQRYRTGDDEADNRSQDAFYAEAVATTFSAVLGGDLDPKGFLAAISNGVAERRLMFWSADPTEQAKLVDAGLNVGLPTGNSTTEVIGVYVQDNVGSKLNYYLQQSIRYAKGECAAGQQTTYRVELSLKSILEPGRERSLSPSILGQWEKEGLAPGVQRMIVYLYAPTGSTITAVSVDGVAQQVEALHDTDHPVARVGVQIVPGATGKVTFDVRAEGVDDRALTVQHTPGVHKTTLEEIALDCSVGVSG